MKVVIFLHLVFYFELHAQILDYLQKIDREKGMIIYSSFFKIL